MKDRAGVVLVIDGRLALIDRTRPGRRPYSCLPGGGVERGETPAEAAIREASEELGVEVALRSEAPEFVLRTTDRQEHYFVADLVGGSFGTGTGEEMVAPKPGRGTYAPVLVPPDEAVRRHLLPHALAERVLRGLLGESWPSESMVFDDPTTIPPWRVRAGAVVIDGDRILLHRAEWDRGPFYEIPGGGVEEGETPEIAVLRELDEEVGLAGEVVRQLALVWKDGRREHYFLVRSLGPSGRTDLDVEEFFVPEWVDMARLTDLPVWPKRLGWRIAEWHTSGRWPDEPVELTDSILDLIPTCRW